MASFAFLYAFALAFVVASASAFPGMMMMSSPEPELDPMGDPALYVVSAGGMRRMMMLQKDNKVCPGDYPEGFSILCDPGAVPSRKARFWVNDRRVKTEYKEPYYIAGDFKGRVKPWKDYPSMAKIRCKVARRTNVYAKIDFEC